MKTTEIISKLIEKEVKPVDQFLIAMSFEIIDDTESPKDLVVRARKEINHYPNLAKYLEFLDRNIFEVKISPEYLFYLTN